MKKIVFILTFLLFNLSCGVQQEASDGSRQSTSINYSTTTSRWDSSSVFPLNLRTDENFTNEELDALGQAAQNWSESISNELTLFEISNQDTAKSSLTAYDDNKFGIYKAHNWPAALPQTALAVTQIFGTRINEGKSSEYIRIDHADIIINYENFTFTTDSKSWGYDLETVVVHEMGHFLGLYHDNSSKELSVMYPTITSYTDNRYPKDNDTSNIKAKYLSNRSGRSAIPEQKIEGSRVEILFELYPDGKELMKINGKIEKHQSNCPHHKH